MMRNVHIVDTTLRDGEQAPDVVFSPKQRIQLARQLVDCGVPEIESGIPAMGSKERSALRELNNEGLPVQLTAWCRAVEKDLMAAERCGYRSVHISLPTSPILLRALGRDEFWVFKRLEVLLPLAVECFKFVSVGVQDASRTETPLLMRLALHVQQLGVDRLRLADSIGCWNPANVHEVIQQIHYAVPDLRLGVHMHNDLGMATANTIAAIQAGATDVDVTVNGLGERAGNAPLEQVALAMRTLPDVSHGLRLAGLYDLCVATSEISGFRLPANQPITGKNAFRHESGIHVHALLSDRRSFEPFSASEVGRSSALNITAGKHSGTSSLIYLLNKSGIQLSRSEALALLPRVRARAEQLGRGLSLDELSGLYQKDAERLCG